MNRCYNDAQYAQIAYKKNDDGKIDTLLEKSVALTTSRSYMDPFPLEKKIKLASDYPPPPPVG